MGSCPHCGAPYPDGATYCASCGLPIAPAAAAGARTDRTLKTVVIVAVAGGCLLFLLAVGGIVAAIAIPNFLDALHKAKQHRTVVELRTLATALESYRERAGSYPAGGAAELGPLLAGYGYQGKLQDGWNRPLRYGCLVSEGAACTSYELASGGRDGVFDHPPSEYPKEAFDPKLYDSDLVVSDGMFDSWPDGQGRLATGG